MSTVSRPTLLPTQPARPQPNRGRIRQRLQTFAFVDLFIDELGWDQVRQPAQAFVVGEQEIALAALAEKRGVIVLHCSTLFDSAMRRKLEQQVAKRFREHLIVYTNAAQTTQIWQWARREAGKPLAVREMRFEKGQMEEAIVQRLAAIAFGIEEEEGLTLVESSSRVRASFNIERVTKRFYERFKAEHSVFLKFIQGIADTEDARWYASVMLNRLMFVYFIQKKGFLGGDPNYLATKLAQSNAANSNFYRDFLRPLFFEGLAKNKDDRAREVKALLGDVPYLNGGIFQLHPLEEQYPPLAIANSAFEKLFAFFDQYQWHLDERPLKSDNEINPDVLGYIFEKYINQKQMGAYYTKEDITEYISQNTVIPFLLDTMSKEVRIAFEGAQSVWGLLQSDPDRYIYDAVWHGVYAENGQARELPPQIAAGIDNVAARGSWNTPAPVEFGLPTEIWRETVARRQRYAELRQQLTSGQVKTTNDLITLNLDIRQFAQDVITYTDSTSLVRAAWKALNSITILDPTCGSGAFLFAALNILEPLYETCLKRMEEFVGRDEPKPAAGVKAGPPDFRAILDEIDSHPNRRYAIFKRIIVNNLFGVDIMEEAIEICKLRLFLKLVAQIDDANRIEPLPDIDFNIRAGNTLVGFATEGEVERALTITQGGQTKLLFGEDKSALDAIKEKAQTIARLFRRFREQQTLDPKYVDPADKAELRRRLGILDEELNQLLARQYGVDPGKASTYTAWRTSHQPFHWYVEFFEVLERGGFDVIIGNPPYVELKAVRDYKTLGYQCETAGNLYALVIERGYQLSTSTGRQGYIVPVSSVSTTRYANLQRILTSRCLHYSSFDDRPSRLFDGLEHIRLTIHLISPASNGANLHSTHYNKWSAVERVTLFQMLEYVQVPHFAVVDGESLPKLTSVLEASILRKIMRERSLSTFYATRTDYRVFYSRKVGHFLQILSFEPKVLDGRGNRRPPSEFKEIYFNSQAQADIALCALNSNLFYWYITAFSDCRHVNKREVNALPIDINEIAVSQDMPHFSKLAYELTQQLKRTSEIKKMKFAHDTLTIQCIYPKHSKSIIDQIDRVLAQHYGFTDEELDFIINYDIKYRLGDELGEDGDGDEDGA